MIIYDYDLVNSVNATSNNDDDDDDNTDHYAPSL